MDNQMNMMSFCLLTLIVMIVLHFGHCDDLKTIYGCEGGSVAIKCPFQREGRFISKSLMRSLVGEDMQEVIRSDGRVRRTRKGRMFLLDKKNKKNIWVVIISDLRVEDAGTYQCVAGDRVFKQVKLSMAGDSSHTGLIKVTGKEGGNAIINCPFLRDYRFAPKLLVNGSFRGAQEVIRSNGHADWIHDGRVSLQDKRGKCIFTVTIRDLTLEDAGIYQCIADGRVSAYFKQLELTVDLGHQPDKITSNEDTT